MRLSIYTTRLHFTKQCRKNESNRYSIICNFYAETKSMQCLGTISRLLQICFYYQTAPVQHLHIVLCSEKVSLVRKREL